jgi:hypothetical protein
MSGAAMLLRARQRVRSGVTPPTAWAANVPSGLSLLRDTSFGNLLSGEAFNADGFAIARDIQTPTADWQNATDTTAPYGPDVLQIDYTAGSLGGGAETVQFYTNASAAPVRAYFCVAVYFSPNYKWHSNAEKFWQPVILTPGEANQRLQVAIKFTDGDSGMDPNGDFNRLYFNSQIGGPGSIVYPLHTAAYLEKGKWQQVEVFCQMNTPGNQDGQWRGWIDGVEVFNVTNVRYTNYPSAAQSYFSPGLVMATTRGGGNSTVAVPTGGMFRRYDRLAFYGSDTF